MSFSSSDAPDTRVSSTRHHDRPDHRPPGAARGQHHQPQAEPHAGIAEVVGVARVAPQAAVHDLALVGRVGLEALELAVADGLEGQADQEQEHTRHDQRAEVAAHVGAHLKRQRHHQHQQPLGAEHHDQRPQVEVLVPVAHDLVAAVLLGVAELAPAQVDAQPQAPRGRQRQQQPPPRGIAAAGHRPHQRHQHERRAPDRVHDRDVLAAHALGPRGHHQQATARAASGRTMPGPLTPVSTHSSGFRRITRAHGCRLAAWPVTSTC